MTPEQAKELREPFPAAAVGKLPKGGTTLDYVGHAAVTDRLLQVDPEWSWEPLAFAADGAPLVRHTGKEAELWIRLTVCGVTRIGVGTAPAGAFELAKQLISDAIRNAAMRFGVALDLWSKEDLVHAEAGQERGGSPEAEAGDPPVNLDELTAQCREMSQALTGAAADTWSAWKAAHEGWHRSWDGLEDARRTLVELSSVALAEAGVEPFDVTIPPGDAQAVDPPVESSPPSRAGRRPPPIPKQEAEA